MKLFYLQTTELTPFVMVLLDTRTFSGLRSLWRILFPCRYLSAFAIFNAQRTRFPPLGSASMILGMSAEREPHEMYSVTKQ